ncbi:MAG: hypothetical protein K8R92_08305 [Planctomycetes bacterium]|nr:hypothetical protein [Planctomycetota bacterium]
MRRFQHLAILCTLLAPAALSAAQAPPAPPKTAPTAKTDVKPPSKELVTSTKPLDAEGLKQIADFVNNRMGQVLEGDPVQVRQATSDVMAVLRQPIATPIFRRAFADALKPFVAKAVAGNDPFRTINVLQIVRWTRTPDALDILIQQVTPASQKDPTIRIGASRLLPGCVATANLTAPQIDSASRRIREAAESESDWIVTVHELQSLSAMVVVAQEGKMPPQLELARGDFLKVLHGSAVKVSKPDGADQVFALQRGLLILRDMLLKSSKDQIDKKTQEDIREITKLAADLSKLPAEGTRASEPYIQSATGAAIVAGVIDKLLGPAGG